MLNNILLVDDDEISSKILQKRLERQGFSVHFVQSGQACLDYLSKKTDCVVLLDITMPEMDGKEVLRKIRQEYSSFEVPVIMLTANKQVALTVECLDLGANDYLTKPVHLDLAVARVRTQQNLVEYYDQSLEIRKIEAINSMVVTYNHEINNPLTIALGCLRKGFDKITPEKIEMTIDALNRISEIVKKIDEVSANPENIEDCTYVNNTKMIKLAK